MFEIGAAYSRRVDIHGRFGGQRQGGISTPKVGEFVFLFTGEAGRKHGYHDEYANDGFHMYGEGQTGAMAYTHGNLAVRDHERNRKRLLLFQATGKGGPCVYRGEYKLVRHYIKEGIPDTNGDSRIAIVFVLQRVSSEEVSAQLLAERELVFDGASLAETTKERLVEVRAKQVLFRDRLQLIEKGCRVTGITDGRFLRASHIKPWAACDEGTERVDGHNGLLLAHHIDHLFDRGWLTFDELGNPSFATRLPREVIGALRIQTKRCKGFSPFNTQQRHYLEYHRAAVFLDSRDLESKLLV